MAMDAVLGRFWCVCCELGEAGGETGGGGGGMSIVALFLCISVVSTGLLGFAECLGLTEPALASE